MKMLTSTTLALCAALTAPFTASAQTEIPLWYGFADFFNPVFEATIGEFNASQDDYVVTWQGYDDYPTTMQAVVAAYRAGNHPPLAMIYDAGTATMVSSGAFVPMQELMANAGTPIETADFVPGAVSYYADAEGNMNALPFFASTAILYANMNQLREVGIGEVPRTWDDLEQALVALRNNGSECPFGKNINIWRDLEQFAAAHDTPLATLRNGYDGLGAELLFNDPLYVAHLDRQIRWVDEGLAVLQGNLGGLNVNNAFAAGKCAIMIGSTASYKSIVSKARFETATGMMPLVDGYDRSNTYIGGNALWVLDGHEDDVYEGIAALMNFIVKDETQETFTRETGYVPVTLSGVEAITKSGLFDEPEFGGLFSGVSSLNVDDNPEYGGIRLGFYPQVRSAWKDQVERAYAGEI